MGWAAECRRGVWQPTPTSSLMYTQTGVLSPSCCRRSLERKEGKHQEPPQRTAETLVPSPTPWKCQGSRLRTPAFLIPPELHNHQKEAIKDCTEAQKGPQTSDMARDSSYLSQKATTWQRPEGDKQPLSLRCTLPTSPQAAWGSWV